MMVPLWSGPQSALDPAAEEAAAIARLFYGMAAGGLVIWLVVIALAIYAVVRPAPHDRWSTRVLVIGGGAVLPTLLLTLLLSVSLPLLPVLHRAAPAGALTIEVQGVQWWWRIAYRLPSGERVETANEIRLPVDRAVQFQLSSGDVVHSFWIPALGGKVDMIPGRQTRLRLHPKRAGVFRGACAEYCGTAHAQMNFDVVVMEPEAFEQWLQDQQQPARVPRRPSARRGAVLFTQLGCGACHGIAGTPADGRVGPDLTHFGSRLSLGAGLRENTERQIAAWITAVHRIKPGAEMPAFDELRPHEQTALASYLKQLQ